MKKVFVAVLLGLVFVTVAFAQIDTGNWQFVKAQNKIGARSECSLVAIEGKLYLIGGDGPAQSVEVYDPKTTVWTKKSNGAVYNAPFADCWARR